MSDVGDEFQQQTKYQADLTGDDVVHHVGRPELYKAYPDSIKVSLPMFEPEQLMTLDEILSERKSIRKYQPKPLSLGQLSYLLWASAGIQRSRARLRVPHRAVGRGAVPDRDVHRRQRRPRPGAGRVPLRPSQP